MPTTERQPARIRAKDRGLRTLSHGFLVPGAVLLLWLVIQIRRKPSLDFPHIHSLATRVILNLISFDLAEGEIFRVGMREIQTADRTGRRHCERFSQLNARVLFVLQ